MSKETKKVTAKQLKVGQEVTYIQTSSGWTGASWTVKEVNDDNVVLLLWGKTPQTYPAYDDHMLFEVEITEQERRDKYQKQAEKIAAALHNKLAEYEIGEHEWNNHWLGADIYELAAACEKNGYTILGYCMDIMPKHSFFGLDLTVAICAEDKDGYKFWCHTTEEHYERCRDMYMFPVDCY